MGIANRKLRSGRASETAARRGRMAAAMSWLAECIVDGLAAYGNAMYPTFVDMGETEDFRHQHWNQGVQGRDEFALLGKNPWLREDLLSGEPEPETETETMVSATEIRDH
jgi:hypothetical protein